jgi:nitroreductase/dihydropteridine reductase
MNLASIVHHRHATKAFDPSRKISAEAAAQLEDLLRFAPSSINSQPWHFVIASSEEGKARIAKATQGVSAYNTPKILNASHVVVFCARQNFDDSHFAAVIDQEEADGRFAGPDAKAAQLKGRGYYINFHRFRPQGHAALDGEAGLHRTGDLAAWRIGTRDRRLPDRRI